MQSALPIAIADRIESWRRPLKDHITGLDARMDDFASDDCIHGPGLSAAQDLVNSIMSIGH